MKLPESQKDFEELLKGIKWNRFIPPIVSVLQPVIIFGLWLGLSRIDNRADAVSKLIAIAEPIPTIDLNIPRPVVLASIYHSVDEFADVLKEVFEFLKDIEVPTAEEVADAVKEELLPDPLSPKESKQIVSDFYDCVAGYERDTPTLLQNKVSKSLYVNTCLLRKGWGTDAVKQTIRDLLT